MRQEYELTQKELDGVLEASKPVPAIMLHIGGGPRTPQENVNAAWQRLGEKYGFVWDTVRPVSGKGQRFVTAETKEQL